MATKTHLRWGVILLLCYGATLIQLQLIHNKQQQPVIHIGHHHQPRLHPDVSSSRAMAKRSKEAFLQQRQNRIQSASRPSHLLVENNLQNGTLSNYKTGHRLYYCKKSDGETVRLPRVPDFIIGDVPTYSLTNVPSSTRWNERHAKRRHDGAHATHPIAPFDCRIQKV
eukprot:scaffold6655_cov169-Amphora_coffeaeformis.AAC.39